MKHRMLAVAFMVGMALMGAEPVKELKVLTIGNSFAASVLEPLRKIAASDPGCKLTLVGANLGGAPMERHWKFYTEGRKPYAGKYSLKEMLTQQKWDIVTIQQVSQFSWKKETYQPYADNLIQLIKECAPSAEIVIQQTWSYHANDPRLTKEKGWKIDQAQMYEKLTECYYLLAKRYNLRIIPTGYAVQLYRKSIGEKLQGPDPAQFKDLKQGVNPVNNDVVGNFQWRKDKKTGQLVFKTDLIHMNSKGAYMQGLVWYGFLFGKNPEAVSYVPKELSKEEAALLKKCAAEAVRDFQQVQKK